MKCFIGELQSKLTAPFEAPFRNAQIYWILTEIDETDMCVFYDDDKQEYGLATAASDVGVYEDINVRGDMVGTFVAR